MSPPTSGTATPGSTTFVSHDLNASVSGRILSQAEPGKVEGLQLELDAEGIHIKHASLVSITIKPDSQTLHSINTGLPLLTLATPPLPPADDASSSSDALEPSPPRPARNVVTLHQGLMAEVDASLIESSPLFSTTFSILIDSPSFPLPHFDPTSIAPPTPSVKAYDPSSSSSASAFGGVLNSPTLQRALLSPLLSPQRRAASQGSDASVPPLSLGLSRTSRQSFSTDRPSRPALPAATAAAPTGLAALLPSLSPAPADPVELATTLTSAISHAAKQTAEDILALRRAHDAYVRRARAELDVLEARIESARSGGAVAGQAGAGAAVVRGFGVPARRGAAAAADQSRRRGSGSESGSESRERGRGRSGSRNDGGAGGRGGSVERSPLGPGPRGVATDTSDPQQPRGRPASSAMNRDEDVSYRLREQDQREEDERGRSRSRQRRDSATTAVQRSRSRTKAIAEATEAAAKVAAARGTSGSRERERKNRTPVEGENIPATLDEDEEEAEEGEDEEHPTVNGLLSPASAATPAGHKTGGATPTFIASTSTKGLVAIPETEELSLPPSEASRPQTPEKARQREKTAEGDDHEHDAPFEMDEDVDVDEFDLSRPIFQQQPPEDELEAEPSSAAPPPPAQQQSASTFKPGSYQRASSLSASYAALLSSSLARRASSDASSDSPSRSPSQAFSSTSATRRGDSALSPPETKLATRTSAREDAHIGASVQSRASPDPRDVRKGEQKIRDVLAMDVPSHRQALPRRRPSGRREGTPTSPRSRSRSDDGEDEDESEADDTVDDRLGASTLSTTSSRFHVGSLPIALAHRPSTQAMSSWRPDPERAWAAEREQRKSSGPALREPATWVPPTSASASVKVKSMGGKLEGAAQGREITSVPLEIGPSRTELAQGQGQGPGGDERAKAQQGRPPAASSLAQSLRNAPPGSFVQRTTTEAEERRNGGVEQLDVGGGAEGGEGSGDDDEAGFVPPHMVAERRARKDERFLSRSISRS